MAEPPPQGPVEVQISMSPKDPQTLRTKNRDHDGGAHDTTSGRVAGRDAEPKGASRGPAPGVSRGLI